MLLFISISILLIIGSFIFLQYSKTKKPPPNTKYPPTEHGIPIFGILFQIKLSLYQTFFRLTKKLGPIFIVKFGLRPILVVNNYKWFQKCFKDNGESFSGRYTNSIIKIISHDSGVLFQDGNTWKALRSFSLRVMKDFGMGKSKSMEIVESECLKLLDELDEHKNKPINFAETIPWYTLNIISKFLMNKRFDKNDKQIIFIKELIEKTITLRDPFQLLLLMFPSLNNSSLFTNCMLYMFKHTKDFEKLHNIFMNEMEEHRKVLSGKVEGEDFIDMFLIEQKASNVDKKSFHDWQLIRLSFELFVAGYETTSSTLTWAMLFLSKYPNVQKEMFDEINAVIGVDKRVTMNDKKSLPYTQAVMDEIMRLHSVAPVALFHRTMSDVVIGDEYFIPTDTMVIPCIFSCLRDPNVWEKPEEFYPEHFLKTIDGRREYNPRDEFVVFGLGKRQCLGESLARMEYFVFLINIVQKFEVRFANKISDLEYEKTLEGSDAIIRSSLIKDFIFTPRF